MAHQVIWSGMASWKKNESWPIEKNINAFSFHNFFSSCAWAVECLLWGFICMCPEPGGLATTLLLELGTKTLRENSLKFGVPRNANFHIFVTLRESLAKIRKLSLSSQLCTVYWLCEVPIHLQLSYCIIPSSTEHVFWLKKRLGGVKFWALDSPSRIEKLLKHLYSTI